MRRELSANFFVALAVLICSFPTGNGTLPGAYSVTVYVFTESNASDGSNGGRTVREEELSLPWLSRTR
jgi:hypothetical protein